MIHSASLTKKAILKCSESFKEEFKQSKCSLTISVGQAPHEAEKFIATLLTVQNNFRECIIMLCDSLQTHTLAIGVILNSEQVHQTANALGDLWLQRNLRFIEQINIPYSII